MSNLDPSDRGRRCTNWYHTMREFSVFRGTIFPRDFHGILGSLFSLKKDGHLNLWFDLLLTGNSTQNSIHLFLYTCSVLFRKMSFGCRVRIIASHCTICLLSTKLHSLPSLHAQTSFATRLFKSSPFKHFLANE